MLSMPLPFGFRCSLWLFINQHHKYYHKNVSCISWLKLFHHWLTILSFSRVTVPLSNLLVNNPIYTWIFVQITHSKLSSNFYINARWINHTCSVFTHASFQYLYIILFSKSHMLFWRYWAKISIFFVKH